MGFSELLIKNKNSTLNGCMTHASRAYRKKMEDTNKLIAWTITDPVKLFKVRAWVKTFEDCEHVTPRSLSIILAF